jgi:hypothetical protein
MAKVTNIQGNKKKGTGEHENVRYARKELNLLFEKSPNKEAQSKLNKDILDMIRLFVSQNNNGQEALYEIEVMQRLLSMKPLSPILGVADEWGEPEKKDGGILIYPNKRCPSVFKVTDKDGRVLDQYDMDALVCSDDGGITWFTTPRFLKKVQFPYLVPDAPERVYIKEVDGAYQLVTDPDEISKMREAAIARKKILSE